MADAKTDVEVTKNEDAQRYEAFIDGERVGFAEYQLTDQLVVFTHTEVEDRCEGLGVGLGPGPRARSTTYAPQVTARCCRCARSSSGGSGSTRTTRTSCTAPR